MDLSNRFSLVDFLAYLFPGILSTLGIYLLLLLTPLKNVMQGVSLDTGTGLLFLALSYIVGIITSGFAEIAVRERHTAGLKEALCLDGFQSELVKAFDGLLSISPDVKPEWSVSHFYLCRSLVFEYMPNVGQIVQRQISLRQLRMNMIPSIMIWLAAAVLWGTVYAIDVQPLWGGALIIGSILGAIATISVLLNRMNDNEKREVRETLTAFLAGCKTGVFENGKLAARFGLPN